MNKKNLLFVALFAFCMLADLLIVKNNVSAARVIIFPVLGSSSYSNDFYAARGDKQHNAIDILAGKGQKLVAAVTGTITDVQYPKPGWGYSVSIKDDDGYEYSYIHLNDDNPGTNDGKGGGMRAYAVDVKEGNRVIKGQHIGYVGDSGYSNGIPHLHFEMYLPSGAVVNPYNSLRGAKKLTKPVSPYPKLPNETLPYGINFKGGSSVAFGNVDADVDQEFITGARTGGSPYLHIFENDAALPRKVFLAFDPAFKGGIDVATGDVDNDGVDEIIVGAGPGGSPTVKVFEEDGTLVNAFDAYVAGFNKGVNVAAGDVDNDGVEEIITGAGVGGGPRITVRKLNQAPIQDYYVYDSAFRGGVDVTAGDLENDNTEEIIIGLGPGGPPRIRVLALDGTQKMSLLAYTGSFNGGVRVSSGNVRILSPEDEILTTPATKGTPNLKMFSSAGALLDDMFFLEEWWSGANYDIAAGDDISITTAGGNRRTTLRDGAD
jgi:hypothetical protein